MHPILIGSAFALALAMPGAAQTEAPDADEAAEFAEDAARDLKDSRFYNRPGATRADYDRDWQECRLIARGSRTPSGGAIIAYNANLISPAAAGAAGGVGGIIGGLIAQGQQRRDNRRECLLVRGWRWVEVDATTKAKLSAMSDGERTAYFDRMVGAADLPGFTVTAWSNSFAAPLLAPASEQ